MKEYLEIIIQLSGLSRKEIADKTGTAVTRFSEWLSEPAKREIQFIKLKEIAEKLGFDINITVTEIGGDVVDIKKHSLKPSIEPKQTSVINNSFDCGCYIESGLLKRAKGSKCRMSKSEHNNK